jgi:replicative superfamily II helicase
MNIFDLHRNVLADYRDFVRSYFTIADDRARGELAKETARIFRTREGKPFHLYAHQYEALRRAAKGESCIVTSGTGSGKNLTYFLPIVDAFLRNPSPADRVAALIVYPMNALVNSPFASTINGAFALTGKRAMLRTWRLWITIKGEQYV